MIVAFMTISTGVGGARVTNGSLVRSAHGFEPGHQVVDAHLGLTLEDLVGGKLWARRFQVLSKANAERQFWKTFEKYLAAGLVNVAVFWSPNVIILGGAVIRRGQATLPGITSQYKKFLKVFPQPPKIVKGTLGDSAGLYGALHLASTKTTPR